MSRFLEALHSDRVLLMDGAMGTELRRLGVGDHEPGEAWNLAHPDRVATVHAAYAAAGATVHLTNTFQLYEDRLGGYTEVFEACREAIRLARSAAGVNGHVLGSLGPPPGPLLREFRNLAGITIATNLMRPEEAGVDGVLIETCSSPRARYAVGRAIQMLGGGQPVLLSLTYRMDERDRPVTASGHSPEWFAKRAAKWGVAALGVNCGRDIAVSDCAAIIRRYRDHTDLPLFARPNAGTPSRVGGQWVYPRSPEQMAAELPELLEAGVRMIGGCCGTTPAHIAAFRAVLADWDRRAPGP